jgi:hypothetical protein
MEISARTIMLDDAATAAKKVTKRYAALGTAYRQYGFLQIGNVSASRYSDFE